MLFVPQSTRGDWLLFVRPFARTKESLKASHDHVRGFARGCEGAASCSMTSVAASPLRVRERVMTASDQSVRAPARVWLEAGHVHID